MDQPTQDYLNDVIGAFKAGILIPLSQGEADYHQDTLYTLAAEYSQTHDADTLIDLVLSEFPWAGHSDPLISMADAVKPDAWTPCRLAEADIEMSDIGHVEFKASEIDALELFLKRGYPHMTQDYSFAVDSTTGIAEPITRVNQHPTTQLQFLKLLLGHDVMERLRVIVREIYRQEDEEC